MQKRSFARYAPLFLPLLAGTSQAVTSPTLTKVEIRSANQLGNSDGNNLYWTSASGLILSSAKLDVTSTTLADNEASWPNIAFALTPGEQHFNLRGNTISPVGSPLNNTWNRQFYRIDLFFNGNQKTAAIHGLISCDTGNAVTNPCSSLVANPGYGPDSLSTTFANQSRVSLTSTTWNYSAEDQMSFGTMEADKNADRLGSFTLAVSAVPEPASYALLLAGLGVVAGAASRQRRATS